MVRRIIVLMVCMVGVVMGAEAGTKVKVDTDKGYFVIELADDKAPNTVKNFLSYVDDTFFNETVFHRVIDGFMIQGGGFNKEMVQKPTKDAIKIESNNGLKNDRGTVAMARTNDPNSATAQFFVNLVNNDFLNYQNDTPRGVGYTVFGKVTEGLDVVDAIAKVKTTTKGFHQDVPADTVEIKSVTRVE